MTINVEEGPAFGAALLAGVGAGIYSNVQTACARTITVEQRTTPLANNAEVYARYYPLFGKLYADLKDDFQAVAEVCK